MKYFSRSTCFIVSCMILCSCATTFSQEDATEEIAPKKITLKISTVETVGTRTQKTWNPPELPMAIQEVPYSEADIAKATPEEAAKMKEKNDKKRIKNQELQAAFALDAYLKASDHYDAVKKQLEGTTFGKQVILAVDKFAGDAGEYFDSDCIEFFHRMDMDEADKESFLKDMKSAPYFIKLVFDDPRIETGKVKMNGQEIKKTKITQGITFSVQELSGKVILSGNIKKEKQNRSTNAVVSEGVDENTLIDLMEEALVDVAKRINKHFVAKVSVKVIGPKKDEDFDPEAATIEVDGVQYDTEEEFTVMKGEHTITVELDGFKQKGSSKFTIKKDGAIKISMKKEIVKQEAEDEE